MASKGDSEGPGGSRIVALFHYVFCGSMTPGVPPSRAYSKVVSEIVGISVSSCTCTHAERMIVVRVCHSGGMRRSPLLCGTSPVLPRPNACADARSSWASLTLLFCRLPMRLQFPNKIIAALSFTRPQQRTGMPCFFCPPARFIICCAGSR